MPNQFTKINVLFSDEDKERLDPILKELRNKGIQVSEDKNGIRHSDIILVALSGNFYEDGETEEVLLNLLGKGAKRVLPVRIDDTPVPDKLKNVLYSRNIISTSGRNVTQTADRIISAIPAKPSVLPAVLIAASAVIAGLAGFFVWLANRPAEEPEPTVEVKDEIVIPANLEGLTDEDMFMITCVCIIGDRFAYSTSGQTGVDFNSFAYETFEDDVHHWYDKEDGHEYQMTHYDDLRFLELMPNLRNVYIALVEADASALPDLGDKLRFGTVCINDCSIDSLEWLNGAKMEHLSYVNSNASDFSPLTSCDFLAEANIDLYRQTEADMSRFAPPKLKTLRIANGDSMDSIDISALSGLQELKEVELDNIPVTDISFLSDSGSLKNLVLRKLRYLNDISALEDQKGLERFELDICPEVTDVSSVAGCTSLNCLIIRYEENGEAIRDVSFLAELPDLQDIQINGCSLYNMDFLKDISEKQSSINLCFSGDIGDYSGLAYVSHYSFLCVSPRMNDDGSVAFSEVLPYISEARIDCLELYDCRGLELSELPDDVSKLKINDADFTDLTGLKPYELSEFSLNNCGYLTSLEGLQELPVLYVSGTRMDLHISGCVRLTDYSVLNDSLINNFSLTGVYALPDFKSIKQIRTLTLESIEGLNDLSILEGANSGYSFDLHLVDLNDLYDLSPLKNLRGHHLTVPPQVEDQAQELVDLGNYSDYYVKYPDRSWSLDDVEIKLINLGELETLPKPLLKRVQKVCIVGDILIDLDKGWAEPFHDGDSVIIWKYHDFETGEETILEPGKGVITDITVFNEMENLKELYLFAQPLENINGIQNLSNLECLQLKYCTDLTDVSAAFACQQLQSINLYGCPVGSIRGVQNLPNLTDLTISETKVTDISPLKDVNYTYANEHGGFSLYLGATGIEDFSPLACVPVFASLEVNNNDAVLFVKHLKGVEIRRITACDCFMGRQGEDPNALLAEFIKDHPEIIDLCISWNNGLTDLTPVITLKNLERFRVSFDMEEAVLSLDGKEYGFEIEIEQ